MLKRTLKRLGRIAKAGAVIGGPTVGSRLTFRAEVMPGRETDDRTYEVQRVLPSGRVELANFKGEHHLTEFEPVTQE